MGSFRVLNAGELFADASPTQHSRSTFAPPPGRGTVDIMSTTSSETRPRRLIDSRSVRASAAITNVALLATAALYVIDAASGTALIMVQATIFALAWCRPHAHPYRRLASFILTRFPAGEPEHPLPVRFASAVGFVFMFFALCGAFAGSAPTALLFTIACSTAAALNAYAGICLACLAYPRVRLFTSRISRRVLPSRR